MRPSLSGKTIVITRAEHQAGEVAQLVKENGGIPYLFSTVEIRRTPDHIRLNEVIKKIEEGEADYILFLSSNAVNVLLSVAESQRKLGDFIRGLRKAKVVAIGPKTADALRKFGFAEASVPQVYTSEGIVKQLEKDDLKGKRVLVPRTVGVADRLSDRLSRLGAIVEQIGVYQTAVPTKETRTRQFLYDLRSGKLDAILFTSSSTATNLFTLARRYVGDTELTGLLRKSTIVALGPITKQTLEALGVQVDIMPQRYLINEMLHSLAERWAGQTR